MDQAPMYHLVIPGVAWLSLFQLLYPEMKESKPGGNWLGLKDPGLSSSNWYGYGVLQSPLEVPCLERQVYNVHQKGPGSLTLSFN